MKKSIVLPLLLVTLLLIPLAMGGCGGRNTSSPARALGGHWAWADSGADWYFGGDGKFAMVWDSGSARGTWTPADVSASARTITANLQFEGAPDPLPYTLKFEADYRTAALLLGDTPVGTLRYVDGKAKP